MAHALRVGCGEFYMNVAFLEVLLPHLPLVFTPVVYL